MLGDRCHPSDDKPDGGTVLAIFKYLYIHFQAYSPPAPPLNEGLAGGYDSDAEGLPGQGNLGGFGEKAVCNFFYAHATKTF